MDELRKSIEDVFSSVDVPSAEQVLAERFRAAIDPGELLVAFRGKHWRDVPHRDLFIHRESLRALSAVGFRAYVAAYLNASLDDDEAPDLVEYTLFSLHPLSNEARDDDETRERLSGLDDAQRSVIRRWLQHVEAEYPQASEILRHWRSGS